MKRVILVVAVVAALVPASAAPAGSRIQAVDTSSFPSLRVTYVAPLGSGAPQLREDGRPVTNYQAVNLGRTKSIVVAIDRSQSMRGGPLANALAAVQQFAASAGATDHVGGGDVHGRDCSGARLHPRDAEHRPCMFGPDSAGHGRTLSSTSARISLLSA